MERSKAVNILVLGAGNFGTCLAQHLACLGHRLTVWARDEAIAHGINSSHVNPRYLQHIELSPRISAVSSLDQIDLSGFFVVVIAIPTQSVRTVVRHLAKRLSHEQLLVCAAKGIELSSHKLCTDIVQDECGELTARQMVSLSGPSFAVEIAQGEPTGVSVASKDELRAHWAQEVFHSPKFRTYTCEDPCGLEVAGALKNVIAIAAGACRGLGLGANSSATLITRGLAEMTRLGLALGAKQVTFNGLGGVGDLFLSSSSEKSRNFTLGQYLGQGDSVDQALKKIGSVAEGFSTSKAAHNLAKKLGVSAPITDSVYQVLHERRAIEDVVTALLNRDSKPEFL